MTTAGLGITPELTVGLSCTQGPTQSSLRATARLLEAAPPIINGRVRTNANTYADPDPHAYTHAYAYTPFIDFDTGLFQKSNGRFGITPLRITDSYQG